MKAEEQNKGMTLLELIISISISVIVILMIITFINGALRVFKKTSNDVNLQMEAQTAVNQLANLIMEAENVSAPVITSDNAERYYVNNIALASTESAIIFSKDSKKLYLVDIADSASLETAPYTDQDNLLAEYVTEFNIEEVSSDIKKSIKEIKIKLELGEDSYQVKKKVSLRNFK
jgi:prepilin-type N-terminal cleavage/methylation domain-containing protein